MTANEIAQLRNEIRDLRDELEVLREVAKEQQFRHVRLAKRTGVGAGEDEGGFAHPFIFVDGNYEDRQIESRWTAQTVKDPNMIVFEQDGQWFRLDSTTSAETGDSGVSHECICGSDGIIQVLLDAEAIEDADATRIRENCECPPEAEPCSLCSGDTPKERTVQISGATSVFEPTAFVTFSDAFITEATNAVNDTHTLTQSTNSCYWSTIKEISSGVETGKVFIQLSLDDDEISLNVVITGEPLIAASNVQIASSRHRKTVSTPIDCSAEQLITELVSSGHFRDIATGETLSSWVDLSSLSITVEDIPLPPPPAPVYNLFYPSNDVTNNLLPEQSITISGLVDSATEPQYDGWAAAVNGSYTFVHRDGGANGYAKPAAPALHIVVPDNSWENGAYPRGPLVIILSFDGGVVKLRVLDSSQNSSRELVYFEDSSTPFPTSGGKFVGSSTYATWVVNSSPDADLTAWLSNATLTLNP